MKILATVIFLERPITNFDWVIYILVGSMLLIALARILLANNFENLYKLERFQEINDNQSIFGLIGQTLFAVLISSLAFSYLANDYDYIFHTAVLKVLAFAGVILGFFGLRKILGSVASFAFGIDYDKNYNQKTFNFYAAYNVGFLWFGVLLFYFSSIPKLILLILIGIILLIIRIITYVKILNNQSEKQTKIWYYNILYLCTLEILPLLVVLKFITI